MKFKVGDKVKYKNGRPFYNGAYTCTIGFYQDGNPHFKETGLWAEESLLELVEEEKEMAHEYEEGKWYMWGGGACPLHSKDKAIVSAISLMTGVRVDYSSDRTQPELWKHTAIDLRVFAFKITKKYVPPVTKEMTVEEISKALGYDVKIVKG